MKHKILISLDQNTNGSELLNNIKRLLNSSHSKILTGLSLSKYLDGKLMLASSQVEKSYHGTSEDALIDHRVDLEIETEKVAKELGMEFKMHKKSIDDNTLSALTTVADLLILEKKNVSKYHDAEVLSDLVKLAACPVLIVTDKAKFENLLLVHDGCNSSVQAVKHFIAIFNQDLRSLPVSVLTSHPKSKRDIESEKVFIDYVKLFFNNIGIQLMTDEPELYGQKYRVCI